jgi:hypothetical protein
VLLYGSTEKTNGGNPIAFIAICAVHERLFGTMRVPLGLFKKAFEDELFAGLIQGISKPVKMIESCFHDLICDFPDIIEGAMGFGLIRGLQLRDQCGRSAVQLAKEVAAESLRRGAYIRASHDIRKILHCKLCIITHN